MSTSIYSNIYANYVGTLMWGSPGSGKVQFKQPTGVAVDSSGNVFVVDSSNNRIQVFQLADPCPSGTQGVLGVCFVTEWGSPGNTNGLFRAPLDVAVDSSGNVFVVDTGYNNIKEFQLADPCPGGTTQVALGVCFVIEWGNPWPGYPAAGNGQFYQPLGVGVDSSGKVFVADTSNNRIQVFQLADPCPGGTTQVALGVCFVIKWGSLGTGNGQFNKPFDVAADSSGNVFVVDSSNNRIQVFQLADPCPSGTTQVLGAPGACYITEWGGAGAGSGKFQYPRQIAVDSSGKVFVADTYNNRIQVFQLADPCPSGTTQVALGVCYITEWGYGGALACILARTFVCHSPPNQFEGPYGVAVDSSGNVFVADYFVDRIHKFIDDIIPPTVTITYPINGATLTHNLQPPHRTCMLCPTPNLSNSINVPGISALPKLEIKATATDNVEVKKVEFYAKSTNGNNVLIGTDTNSPYSIPLTSLTPDTYILTAKAYDTADNTSISTSVTMVIQ